MKDKTFITALIIIAILITSTAFKKMQGKMQFYAENTFTDTTKKGSSKKDAKKNESLFDYPGDMHADTAKKRFVKEFNKGKILYSQNCAKCHAIIVDKKPVVPDFSLPQLMDYEIRIQYQAHEEDLKETNISHDELEYIVLYLRYKKRSGTPYKYLLSSN